MSNVKCMDRIIRGNRVHVHIIFPKMRLIELIVEDGNKECVESINMMLPSPKPGTSCPN